MAFWVREKGVQLGAESPRGVDTSVMKVRCLVDRRRDDRDRIGKGPNAGIIWGGEG